MTEVRMRRQTNIVMQYYRQLNRHFGDLHWWPAESPVEVVIGAVLTQNTNWSNVEKAICNLDARGCLRAEAILALPKLELEQLIRPSGYFRLKAARLRRVMEWYSRHEKASPPPFYLVPGGKYRRSGHSAHFGSGPQKCFPVATIRA